jgi:hypothetical protein
MIGVQSELFRISAFERRRKYVPVGSHPASMPDDAFESAYAEQLAVLSAVVLACYELVDFIEPMGLGGVV